MASFGNAIYLGCDIFDSPGFISRPIFHVQNRADIQVFYDRGIFADKKTPLIVVDFPQFKLVSKTLSAYFYLGPQVAIDFSQVLVFVLDRIAGCDMLNHFTPFRIPVFFYHCGRN
jgi:hypothetical protein